MAALSYRKIGSGNVSKPHAHVWAQDHGYFTPKKGKETKKKKNLQKW